MAELAETAMRGLLQSANGTCLPTMTDSAGWDFWYQTFSDGTEAVCCLESDAAWEKYMGTQAEYNIALGCQWLAFSLCIFNLAFYGYHYWKATTGWEEVYVVLVELIKVCLEVSHEADTPATLYLSTGKSVLWIRYGEWLLTCPVILIHLSNITGLKDDYNKRTMMILISDLGTITMGITSALSTSYVKWIFFLIGLIYGSNTYFNAAKVYVEAYHMVPKGVCRNLVRGMAWCFYVAWTMFPLLFAFGPEGFNIMSRYGSNVAHTIADMLSKQIWGFLGHMLRVKIHEHIIIHGHLTKTTKVQVAGMEIETETMVEKEEADGAVDQGTAHLANRESFLVMRDRMKQQGVDVRATFDTNDLGSGGMAMRGNMPGGSLEPGRVILAVPDISMVDFFRQQFAMLPAPIELVPALGSENTLALVNQAMQLGGLDCVLMHPEFLRDRTPTGLLMRLKAANQRVIAFGWSPMGPIRELIETSGADGFLEGPSFGMPLNQQQLVLVLARTQQMRKMMAGMGMGMGMMGGMMGGNPMMGGMGMGMMGGMGGAAPNGMLGANPLFGGSGMVTPTSTSMFGNTAGPAPAAAALGGMAGTPPAAGTPGSITPARAAAAAPAGGEAEMLQQLMAEINRLKSELGDH